jgi:hypothetical protein
VVLGLLYLSRGTPHGRSKEMTIKRLQELISQTHQHGVKLAAEIRALEQKRTLPARIKAKALRGYLRGLEALNARRRKELANLEHHQPPKPAPKPHPAPRFDMYDSTVVAHIPSGAVAVAGYVNGSFANFNAMVARFPHAKHLSISVNSSGNAKCLDIEKGDATPADAPAWVRRQHARGEKEPVVYANTSTMPAVIDALTKNGIKRDEYLVWTAHYTNIPHVEPGSDATQWQDHDELYDESLCESWFL